MKMNVDTSQPSDTSNTLTVLYGAI